MKIIPLVIAILSVAVMKPTPVDLTEHPIVDVAAGSLFVVHLSKSTDAMNPVVSVENAVKGQVMTFVVYQDGKGNHRMSWGKHFVGAQSFGSGSFGNPENCYMLKFVWDGEHAFMAAPVTSFRRERCP